jgi:hypothetical protein
MALLRVRGSIPRRRRCMRAWPAALRAVLAAFSLVAAACAHAASPPYTAQTAGKHSWLAGSDNVVVRDDQFAFLMALHLTDGGVPIVKDAKFLFQQCFGGGMLDDLKNAMPAVKWIGGAASRYDQCSYSGRNGDAWTEALLPELRRTSDPPPKLTDGLDVAARNDRAADTQDKPHTGGKPPESPQKLSNNGDDISLQDPDAKSHHAILWSGSREARHLRDLQDVRSALERQWRGTNATIQAVTTYDELLAAMDNLRPKLNDTEQFFFYSTGHGWDGTHVIPAPILLEGNARRSDPFRLVEEEIVAIRTDPDNVPQLQVAYSSVVSPVEVRVNGFPIGFLEPELSGVFLTIPEEALDLENFVEIMNPGPAVLTLASMTFLTGSIATLLVVDEPPPAGLLVVGLMALLTSRRRAARPEARKAR